MKLFFLLFTMFLSSPMFSQETSEREYDEKESQVNYGEEVLDPLWTGNILNPQGAERYNYAIKLFDKAIAIDSNYCRAYKGRGIARFYNEDYLGALTDLSRALQDTDQSFSYFQEVYKYRGITKSSLKDFKGALADYFAIIKLSDELNFEMKNLKDYKYYDYVDPVIYYNIGVDKISLKDYHGAIFYLDKGIKIKGPNEDLYKTRAKAKEGLGDKKGALEDYNKIEILRVKQINEQSENRRRKSDLHSALIYYQNGFKKKEMGFNNNAIIDFDNAISLNPNYAPAYYNRGSAKANIRNYKGAIADYNMAIALKIQPLILVVIYYQRGLAKIADGDREGGCIDLKRSLDSGHRSATQAISKYCR